MISERIHPARPQTAERGFTIPIGKYWNRLPLLPVLLLAAILNFYQLSREGYSNAYYAAAIKSMMQNWHNFFFNSFDPGGFVTIDKPPLGFWLQVASAKLFGFSGVALMLPQALAGVLSVALLYYLISRMFGRTAGLLAALALAVTPISVVTNRNNTIDSTLVLVVLLGAWAVSRAVETGKLRWLLLCAVFVGLGFNIKMLQAYLVLPAFGLFYLLAARIGWRRRLLHLVLATVVLLVVSLSWVTAVDLTPASQRPWFGSTTNNSALSLATGYNGLQRLTGNSSVSGSNAGGNGNGPGGVGENGPTGPLRLLNSQLGSQIGWLLPLAVIGFFVAAWRVPSGCRRRGRSPGSASWPLDERQGTLVMWGMWLLTTGAFFSVAGFYHTYYLVMVAPAIAALSGIGVVTLWHAYRQSRSRIWWLLPASLLAVAGVQAHILADYPAWARWLTPLIVGTCVMAAVVLIVAHLRPKLGVRVMLPFAALGAFVLLAAPTVWAADSVSSAVSGGILHAGPSTSTGLGGRGGFGGPPGGNGSAFRPPSGGFRPPSGSFGPPGGSSTGRDGTSGGPGGGEQVNAQLLRYLEHHQGKAKYLVATTSAGSAESYILATGKPVMALGGFTGNDPILTVKQLAALVKQGTVRYFLVSGGGRGGPGRGNSALTTWIQQHSKLITVGGVQLYEYTG
jgi:4-amino-4-deoxy-L-arabinose transferase-like glycosyltransferase